MKTLWRGWFHEASREILSNCYQFIRWFQSSSCPSVGQFPHLNGEGMGLSALPWSLPAFSLPDPLTVTLATIPVWIQVCMSESVVLRLPLSKKKPCDGLKCRFLGHTQTNWIRIGGRGGRERGKIGRNLYFTKCFGWFFGTLRLENHQYSLRRTIQFCLKPPISQLSRKQLIHLTNVYCLAP